MFFVTLRTKGGGVILPPALANSENKEARTMKLYTVTAYYITSTSTLWNTIECCRGFENMKDEISSSLKASDIFGLIFY